MKLYNGKEHTEYKLSAVSVKLIFVILTVALVLYFCALSCISCACEIFPDMDTAYYWFEQFAAAGKEVLGLLTAVFIFEIILICTGKKE